MRLLIGVVTLSGCFASSAVPVTMHPTASTADKSVGVAVGGLYEKQKSNDVVSIPYGEGAIRTPVGDGQLGLHVGPSVAHLGYRYDVAHLSDGVGVGLEPLAGVSYTRYTDASNPNMKDTSSATA